jgi:hypothetical protein
MIRRRRAAVALAWAAIVAAIAGSPAHAQPPLRSRSRAPASARALTPPPPPAHADDRDKHHGARRASEPPLIDGRLDDRAWAAVPADSRFTQNFPDEGRPPSQRTELRVLYDDEALYLGVRAWDDDAAHIVERLTRRDRETDADKITVEISSKNDRTTAYHFDVNCAGVLADGVRFNDTDYSGDWDGLWLGAAHRDADGWSAELKIPFQTLRYEGGRDQFGFQVRRHIQRREEIDEWAYTPRTARGEVSYYGVLDGLAGLRAARLFQIVPYFAAGLFIRYGGDNFDGTSLYGNLGGDLKLGLTSALTLDVTINPDFGQVEADQVVLNLTTFEVFFPEKRAFFLEGVDLFATPIELFYSRRIGRPPPAPNGYDATAPLPTGRIWAAVKLTGLVAPRLSVAMLDAITDSSSVEVTAEGGQRIALGLQPLSNYFVARLKRDVLARSYVGLTATGVSRFEQEFVMAPFGATLCPDDPVAAESFGPTAAGRCTHDAYAAGVDAFLTTRDGTYQLRAQATGSVIVGGPRRRIADGHSIGANDVGAGLRVEGGKQGGNFNVYARWEGYSPRFDINDVGYLRQSNMHFVHAETGWRILKPTGFLLEGNVFVGLNFNSSWNGDAILGKNAYLSSWLRFKNYWTAYLEVDWDLDHDDNRETRDGAIVQRIGGFSSALSFKTDPRRKIVAEGEVVLNHVRYGQWVMSTLQLHLRPVPAVEIDIIPHLSWTWGDPRWYDTRDNGDAAGTKTYFFGELDSRELDVTVRGTYTFTPTLTLQAYAQLYVDGGHYGNTTVAVGKGRGSRLPFSAFRPAAMPRDDQPDFRNGSINVNLVLRWEFQPGSTILGVYTHAQDQREYDPLEGTGRPSLRRFGDGRGTDLFLVKLSLLLM